MNYDITREFIDKEFISDFIPGLSEFIKIPNLSPLFDPEWQTNGHLEKAANYLLNWSMAQNINNLKGEIIGEEGRTPLVLIQIEGEIKDKTVLLYGHYDKQSHYSDWRDDLGPNKPVIKGDLLYGRGAADDGYAFFSAILSIKAIQHQKKKHGKIIVLIEGSEESGSIDLLYYIDNLQDKIPRNIDLIISLDSGCQNYDRLWINISQRGIIIMDIKIQVLEEGVHSGTGSGIAPDPFMILRQILDRIEDSYTGCVIKDFHIDIPENRITDAEKVAEELKSDLLNHIKFYDGVKPINDEYAEIILNNTWRPTVTITGSSGLPPHKIAGNVLRPSMEVRLSMRLPPTLDCVPMSELLYKLITEDPPFNAKITVKHVYSSTGWNANELSQKLRLSLEKSCYEIFGKNYLNYGDGGSNSFMSKLVESYPNSEFLVLGVLGPGSNTHSVNEALNLPYCKKLITVLSHTINEFCN